MKRGSGRPGNPLFATLSVDRLRAESERPHGLKRNLTAPDLLMLGIGPIIGPRIFVLTGPAPAPPALPPGGRAFAVGPPGGWEAPTRRWRTSVTETSQMRSRRGATISPVMPKSANGSTKCRYASTVIEARGRPR